MFGRNIGCLYGERGGSTQLAIGVPGEDIRVNGSDQGALEPQPSLRHPHSTCAFKLTRGPRSLAVLKQATASVARWHSDGIATMTMTRAIAHTLGCLEKTAPRASCSRRR